MRQADPSCRTTAGRDYAIIWVDDIPAPYSPTALRNLLETLEWLQRSFSWTAPLSLGTITRVAALKQQLSSLQQQPSNPTASPGPAATSAWNLRQYMPRTKQRTELVTVAHPGSIITAAAAAAGATGDQSAQQEAQQQEAQQEQQQPPQPVGNNCSCRLGSCRRSCSRRSWLSTGPALWCLVGCRRGRSGCGSVTWCPPLCATREKTAGCGSGPKVCACQAEHCVHVVVCSIKAEPGALLLTLHPAYSESLDAPCPHETRQLAAWSVLQC